MGWIPVSVLATGVQTKFIERLVSVAAYSASVQVSNRVVSIRSGLIDVD